MSSLFLFLKQGTHDDCGGNGHSVGGGANEAAVVEKGKLPCRDASASLQEAIHDDAFLSQRLK